MSETYISVDVETTGPVPSPYAMIELGAVALSSSEGKSFSVAIKVDENISSWHPGTYGWWHEVPDRAAKLKAIEAEAIEPRDAMALFADWLKRFHKPVLIGFPIVFDAMFINWYWWNYVKEPPPFSHSGLDIKTLAARKLNIPYREATKKRIAELAPQCFNASLPHTHRAVQDAAEQLYLYRQLLLLPGPPDNDLMCHCGHRFSHHSERSFACYGCICDFAKVS